MKLSCDLVHPVVEEGSRGRVLHCPIWKAALIDGHAYVGTDVGSGNNSAYHGRASPATPEPAARRHRDKHHVLAEDESSNPWRQPAAKQRSWSIGQYRTQLLTQNATGSIGGRWCMKRQLLAWPEH